MKADAAKIQSKKGTKKLQTLKNKGFAAFLLVSPAGVEPTAFRLGGERSIQLSYEDLFTFVAIFRSFQKLELLPSAGFSSAKIHGFFAQDPDGRTSAFKSFYYYSLSPVSNQVAICE